MKIHEQLERRPLTALEPYARNARTHSLEQVAQIAASIQEFGFTNPVLIDPQGGIIAGHGRVLAAAHLSMESVPCLILAGLTDAQKRAYVLADNQLALNAGWDYSLLKIEWDDLGVMEFDRSLLGFDAAELDRMFAQLADADGSSNGLSDPDDVPEPTANPVTQPGDVWLLGRHRLMCGDSTDKESVVRLMSGEIADLCLTDPPYGLGDTSSKKNDYDQYKDTLENLRKTVEVFLPIARSVAPVVVLTPGIKNHRIYPEPNWIMAWFYPAGKGCGPWGFCCWQPILCYGKDPKLSNRKGSHPDAIIHKEIAEKLGHPCTKPIKFWKWLTERTSEIGCLIFEPFSGSGTTIMASEQTGRRCFAMELSPQYVDVAVRRWQQFTGRTAYLESTGAPFPSDR